MDNRLWCIFLHQMAATHNLTEVASRYLAGESTPRLNRNPLIVDAPEQMHWASQSAQLTLNGISVGLVHLRNLLIEGGLSHVPAPGRRVGVENIARQITLGRARNISVEYGRLDVVWKSCIGDLVLSDVLNQGRAPWADRDGVNQQKPVKIYAVQQVCTKHGGAPKVMRYDVRLPNVSMAKKGNNNVVLHAKRNIGTERFV